MVGEFPLKRLLIVVRQSSRNGKHHRRAPTINAYTTQFQTVMSSIYAFLQCIPNNYQDSNEDEFMVSEKMLGAYTF
jgi:hypothetical protein